LLIEAKADCRHGEWLPFLNRAGVPERKAQRLMTLARSEMKSDAVSDLGGIKPALEFYSKFQKVEATVKALEFDGWVDIFQRAIDLGQSSDEFCIFLKNSFENIDIEVLGRDTKRIISIILLNREMSPMFDSLDSKANPPSRTAA
jgi:hypothetical protein